MNYYRERLILVALFCSHLYAMEDRHLTALHTAHRRVPSADTAHERPSFSGMAHMQHLRDALTSSGGYPFAEERPATRSRSNSAVLGPVIEISSLEVHHVNDSFEDTGSEFECEDSNFSSDECSEEGGIAMEDLPAPWSDHSSLHDSFPLQNDATTAHAMPHEQPSSVRATGSKKRVMFFDGYHTPMSDDHSCDESTQSGDGQPLYEQGDDATHSLRGSIDSSDSENDPFEISAPPGSPLQRPAHYHIPTTPSVAAKTVPYGKLAGCAIGAYVIYNVIDSLVSQCKQERARKKKRISDNGTNN